jgi:heme/copper-type cytochrome/quinol oxidase subunit 3
MWNGLWYFLFSCLLSFGLWFLFLHLPSSLFDTNIQYPSHHQQISIQSTFTLRLVCAGRLCSSALYPRKHPTLSNVLSISCVSVSQKATSDRKKKRTYVPFTLSLLTSSLPCLTCHVLISQRAPTLHTDRTIFDHLTIVF